MPNKIFEDLTPKLILDIIHDPKYVLGIWWYDVKNKKLDYYKSNEVKGHDDLKFQPFLKSSSKKYLEKGRVFKYGDKTVLLVYSTGYGKTTLNGDEILDLLNKIETIENKTIFYVINDKGENLLENKVIESLLKYFNSN